MFPTATTMTGSVKSTTTHISATLAVTTVKFLVCLDVNAVKIIFLSNFSTELIQYKFVAIFVHARKLNLSYHS